MAEPAVGGKSGKEVDVLKIYGWKRSRAVRCMWVLEELGLPYEQVPLNPHAGETRTPEYLALNPSGKIPTLVHDDFVLSESVAINWYLAANFPGSLLPRDVHLAAEVQQWTSWAVTELEPPLVAIMREGRRSKEQIDAARIEAARAEVHGTIGSVLEPALAGGGYLLESQGFTLADLNVACVASVVPMFDISLERHPAVADWMRRCFAREAWARAQQRS
jgi:glutathione S-transferase